MDMIFGMFSETNVRLLKIIISQFFSKYSKRYNILNIKKCLKLNGPWQNTGRVEVVKLHVSNRTLQELSKMALIKYVAFVVFEILRNLISMQNVLKASNC